MNKKLEELITDLQAQLKKAEETAKAANDQVKSITLKIKQAQKFAAKFND